MKKILTVLGAGLVCGISMNASTPVKKNTVSIPKDSIPSIGTRQGYHGAGPVYKAARDEPPLPNSIHVNRGLSNIPNYKPDDLVKEILLNSHSPSDKNRIQNVEHIGWNWDQSSQQWKNQTYTPSTLGSYGVWGDARSTSVVYAADERSLAYFSNGTNSGFQIDSGLLLGTGPVLMVEGPNVTNHGLSDGVKNDGTPGIHTYNSALNSVFAGNGILNPSTPPGGVTPHEAGWYKHKPNGSLWLSSMSFDRDLDALTADSVLWSTCGSVLEFDFQPAVGQATFDYIFASDEYPEGCYSANDVFGFFISGPFDSPSGSNIEAATDWSIRNPVLDGDKEHTRSGNDSIYYRYNIARLPDNQPVGIDYVNWGTPAYLYENLFPFFFGSEYNPTSNITLPYVGIPAQATVNDKYGLFDPTAGMSVPPAGGTFGPVANSYNEWGYYKLYTTKIAPAEDLGIFYTLSTPGNYQGTNYPAGTTLYPAIPNNPHLFRYNHVGSDMMEYDGYTTKLQAIADKLIPGKWYHLKLAICQTVQSDGPTVYYPDNNHGSGVFLANLDLGKLESNLKNPYMITELDKFGQDAEGNSYLYDGCDQYTLTFTFDSVAAKNQSTINLSYENLDPNYLTEVIPNTIVDKYGDITYEYKKLFPNDTLQLTGIHDTIRHYQFRISTDYPDFKNGDYIKIITSVVGGNSDTLKHQLFNRIGWDVRYTPVDPVNPGSLRLNLIGGSYKIFYSLDNGDTWHFARDTTTGKELAFSNWELLSLDEKFDILLKEPSSCWMDTIHINKGSGSVTLRRYIDIPKVDGMTTNPKAGKHYAEGHKDFFFYATFSGEPLSIKAKGYYSNTILDLGSNAEPQPDGSYKYTIRQVTEPWTVFIDNESNNGVSNQLITGTAVWTNNSTLYMHSPASSVANIYTTAGALYKQIEVHGNKAIQLPRGFYIVTINNKQYKVIIK